MVTGAREATSGQYQELFDFLRHLGKDPSRLVFEDELTELRNRRFLRSYFENSIRWETGEDFPLSLLVLDLDHFKTINDDHGHETGDRALTWVAALLRGVSGEKGIPIRFAGDEFIIVLPGTTRAETRLVAERLLQLARSQPFRVGPSGTVIPITLSIGIASAPADATDGRTLFQSADTALYHAKQSGRDRVADSVHVDPEKVFPKTALHRIDSGGIGGRERELEAVSEAFEALSRGKSRFLVFEGEPGMGKSALLATIRDNLAGDEACRVARAVGDPMESRRPYYLAQQLVVSLLDQRADKGEEILESLDKRQLGYLSLVLPRLGDAALHTEQDPASLRQGVFTTLAQLIPALTDFRPLVLILDDVHDADEASLLLLHSLLLRGDLKLLVLAARRVSPDSAGDDETSPMARFLGARERELGIRREKLAPLGGNEIAEYLKSIFPGLRMPAGFEHELARATEGNPHFLSEVIRKLVADRNVVLDGGQWVVRSIEPGYMPRSLEETVQERIMELDDEGRDLLERASAIGGETSVSVLAGSSGTEESRVLEFLDRAEALGLVHLDFDINDEVIRFLGNQVREISYEGMRPGRREEIHRQIGTYEEHLYEQRVLPSASTLAHHFHRSADQNKASHYERIRQTESQRLFNPEEAISYTETLVEEDQEDEPRLDPESFPLVPAVIRSFTKAVRNVHLYPSESETVARSLEEVRDRVDEILQMNEWLHLSHSNKSLLANGQRVDLTEAALLADVFLELLTRSELQGMTFLRGLEDREIRALVLEIGEIDSERLSKNHWKDFQREHRLDHIELEQVTYSRLVRRHVSTGGARSTVADEDLFPDELAGLPEILRALQGATKIAKLYPADAPPVAAAVTRLLESLQPILEHRPSITLAGVNESLIVNGNRVDTAAFDVLAATVVREMAAIGLASITFFEDVDRSEIEAFVTALRDAPAGAETKFWDGLAEEEGVTGIAFNARQYALSVVQDLVTVEEEGDEERHPLLSQAERLADQSPPDLMDALPRFGPELMVRSEHDLVQKLLKSMFSDFEENDPEARENSVKACSMLLGVLILGQQRDFARLSADILLGALDGESETPVLREFGVVLQAMANIALQFGDYTMTSRILLAMKTRQEEMEGLGLVDPELLSKLLDRPLDAELQATLIEDLRSGDPDRECRAAGVVGAMGAARVPLLVEVIKLEDNLRVRLLAAKLLAEAGPVAAKAIKQALATEPIDSERLHLIEIVDTITRDLRGELINALEDDNPAIRHVALRLFERLGRDDLVRVVAPHALASDRERAQAAIRSLGVFGTTEAVKALASVLRRSRRPEIRVACCQALGRADCPTRTEALVDVLEKRRFLLFGRRYTEPVRAAAAGALSQISDPRAAEALQRLVDDSHSTVRQIALETVEPVADLETRESKRPGARFRHPARPDSHPSPT